MAFKSALDDLFKGKSLSFNGASASSDTTAAKVENGENMKSKILETWNNIRYDMKSGTSLKKDSPLWLLGKCYHTKQVFSTDTSHNADDSSDHSNGHPLHLKMFLKDLGSKPWFTYRKGFAPLNGTGMKLTSDTGWGCMLRTAQMMVAQSLITHLLGREWRLSDQHILEQTHLHRSIITWFLDEKNVRCPFSIHQLTEIGLTYRCSPGNWYGPNTAAYIMQDALECGRGNIRELDNIAIYIAQDSTVYIDDVTEMGQWEGDANLKTPSSSNGNSDARPHIPSNSKSGQQECNINTNNESKNDTASPIKKSVLILIPVRLGEATLNPIYIPCINAMLTLDQCVGIMGGKPKHSLYFVGFQDEYLFYLDPHYCQPADKLADFKNNFVRNYHCQSLRKTHISNMDPSCCLGFYCRDYEDFQSFVTEANKLLAPPNQRMSYPLCLIMKGSALDHRIRRKSELESYNIGPTTSGFTEIQFNGESPKVEPTDEIIALSEDDRKPDEKFSFSFASTKSLITNMYKSKSPRLNRKNQTMEEEFEML